MQLKTIFTAAALAVTALSGQAATVNWGAHRQLESSVGLSAGGPVSDDYSFTLASSSSVASSVSVFGTIGGTYRLVSAGSDGILGNGDDVTYGTWNFGGLPTVSSVLLAAGSYHYLVNGTATSLAAYSINSSAVAVPVPEPETYALFAAGLGMVGFIASRRRRD